MNRILFSSIVLMACLAVWAGGALGAEFCVSNETDLQAALTMAATNGEDDVIKVQQGTYIGNFSYSSSRGNSITLLGGYTSGCTERNLDPSNTVLDGGGSGRVLRLFNSNGGDIFLEGLTLRNGNTINFGGGVYACSFLYPSRSGNITLTNNTVTGNTADGGGGVYAYSWSDSGRSGNVTLSNNTIMGNTANYNAGGLQARSDSSTDMSGDVTLTNNTVSGNTAGYHGGGVYAYSDSSSGTAGNVTLTSNTVTENTAIEYTAGGITAYSSSHSGTSGDVTLTNNVIARNTANSYAGGVIAVSGSDSGTSGDVTLTNNTVTGNTAGVERGGGVYISKDDNIIDIYNNIIWGNTAPQGADIYFEGSGIANGFNNDYSDMAGSWTNFDNNINTDPLFMDVSDPDPVNWDLHLQSTSPCIDAGKNTASKLPAIDFEGDPRIIDGDYDGKAKVDIGADEYGSLKLTSPNGGEVIPSGSPFTIQWAATLEAVSFKLKYSLDNGRTWKPIESEIAETSYEWDVPIPKKNKKRCLVKVIGYDDSEEKVATDKSNSTFTIAVVEVTSPNGGETLISGTPYTIEWDTHGTKKPVAKVVLKYTKNAGRTWKKIKPAPAPGDPGSYEWTVPGVPKTKSKCLVKVVLKDANGKTVGSDTSDGYFTIEPTP